MIKLQNIPNLFHLLAVWLLSLIVLAPVLISPHWGLFSDAFLILTFPPILIGGDSSSVELLAPWPNGRWFPFFHVLTALTYWIFGKSAFAFYVIQWGMLAIVLSIVFQLTYQLTQNNRVTAWLSIILILLGAPLHENFFTLDKSEPRTGLFSMLAFSWLAWGLWQYWDKKPSRSYLIVLFYGQFILAVFSIFTKETGVFLLPVSLLMLILLWVQKRRMTTQLTVVLIFLIAQVVAFLLFRLLFWVLADVEGMTFRYTDYEISFDLISRNSFYYLNYQPEIVLTVMVFLSWLTKEIVTGSVREWAWSDLILSGAGLAGCTYFGGILLWRWPLNYFLYPATIFLSITLSVLAYRYLQFGFWPSLKPVRLWGLLICLPLIIGLNIPQRFYTGMAIYAQDQAKDMLAQTIQQEATATTRLAVLLFYLDSVEIGESFEFFINQARHENKLELFNMVEGPWVNRQDLNRFQGSLAPPPSKAQLKKAMQLSTPYLVWRYDQIDMKQYKEGTWQPSPLNVGDWLLVPVGNESNRFISARGISLYSQQDLAAYQPYTLGLQLKERFKVRVPIGFWGSSFLGWDVVEVTAIKDEVVPDNIIFQTTTSITPSSNLSLGKNWYPLEYFDGEFFRWVNNDAEVMVILPLDVSPALSLELEPGPGIGSKPFILYIQDEAGQTISQHDVQKRQTISIPLPQLQVDKPQRFRFHIEEGGLTTSNDPRTLNFRVFRLEWRK